MRPKAFTPQRWRYEVDGQEFIITKGDSKHSRFYLRDEDGNYLTSKPNNTLLDAQIEATKLARKEVEATHASE